MTGDTAVSVPNANGAPPNLREGVLWHEPSRTDLLFVTLNKSESLFSPSTRYRDLPLAPLAVPLGGSSATLARGQVAPTTKAT